MSEIEKGNEVAINENYELTAFEESIATAIATSELKPGLDFSKVFGKKGLGDIQSFGGNSLAENSKKVDNVLQNSYELQRVWNRSHSNWLWRHVNLTYHSPYTNIRQLAAEIQKKRGAINSAKWNQIRAEMKIRKMEEKLIEIQEKGTSDKYKEAELMISIAQAKEGMADGMAYIEGAMKDVLELGDLYEQMKAKHGGFNETDIENEETKSHLRRSIVQSLRDVRQTGRISKGEQEYMEQIGVNVSKMEAEMQNYVQWERGDDAPWDNTALFKFVEDMTEKLYEANVAEIRMGLLGLEEKVNDWNTYKEPVGTDAQLTHKE